MTQPDGFRLFPAIARIDARQWDALVDASAASAASAAPCVRHAFLRALEESGCVGGRSGWTATHATLWRDGSLCAAMPLYLKAHSWGEYVFDWAWAEAYQRHGLDYYPKWLGAVPFTPIPGPRLLGRDDGARRELLAALLGQARESGLSSLHLLFPLDNERALLEAAGLMIREGVQFHWENPPASANESESPGAGAACSVPPRRWAGFEDFLASLAGSKRKKIRQERRRVSDAGVTFRWSRGTDISEADWDFFYRCYERTYREHGNPPYLSRDFFGQLAQQQPEQWLLFLARNRQGQRVAASLVALSDASAGSAAAYGRYWGALERVDCLHFEACYYQPLQWCIDHGVQRFEGGAQGEHKMARALLPMTTQSAHWLAHPAFADAVERFLVEEGRQTDRYLDHLESRNPLKPAT